MKPHIYFKTRLISASCLRLFIFCLIGLKSSQAQNSDIFNFDNSIKFANYLFNGQQFREAALEYDRLSILYPLKKDSLVNLSILCSAKAKDYFKAKQKIINKSVDSCDLQADDALMFVKFQIAAKQYSSSILNTINCNKSISNYHKNILGTYAHIVNAEYKLANENQLKLLPSDTTTADNFLTKTASSILLEQKNVKYKNKYVAMSYQQWCPD